MPRLFASLQAGLAFAYALLSLVRADYDPSNLPATTEANQTGFNDCQARYGDSSSDALCNNIFINNVRDFCVFAPRERGPTVGDAEETVVSYCIKSGYGTRLIPEGTITGAHFLKTPSYVQVTGQGDFTRLNILPDDQGGELDPHGATGVGNPPGSLVFTRAFTGDFQQIHEWQHFIDHQEFCFRACIGDYAANWCPHIYDVMGCKFNEPGNYDIGTFDDCDGSEGEWPGVYNGHQWFQGQKPEPPAQAPGVIYNCTSFGPLKQGRAHKIP